MANYSFRPAKREEVGLLVGLIGPSGSGKTYSALRMATGIVGNGGKFAFIDTENRRGLHYADQFQFDYCEITEPFRPSVYADAILAADKAGYKVIVVDSMSHEWAGVGGILDWQEEELSRMAGDSYQKREACKMASWIKPKMQHKQMMSRLLQVKANLILCFRAEEKLKMEKVNGKTEIVPIGFQPICEKNLPYELTISMLLDPEKPGAPKFLKLQQQHKSIFAANALIDENAGKAMSEWAKGGEQAAPRPQPASNGNAELIAEASSLAKNRFPEPADFKTFRQEIIDTDAALKNLTDDQLMLVIDALKEFDSQPDSPTPEEVEAMFNEAATSSDA